MASASGRMAPPPLHARMAGNVYQHARPRRALRPTRTQAFETASHGIYEIAEAFGDAAPEWTLDQIVGLVFGALLVAVYLSSSKVDEFVARSQRRQLGLCEQCGGLYSPDTCKQLFCPQKQKQRRQ